MKPIKLATLFVTFSLGLTHAMADQTAATITQSSDKITRSMSATGAGESAGAGTALHNGEFVKTSKSALAELVLANKTVTRLGPNTVVAYSAASREATVNSGTLLFSKPKDGEAMTFQMGSVTAAVTGTTGFVERTGDSVYLGIIEGTVQVTVGAAKAVLHAGNMLVANGKTGQVVSFDVPHFVTTSAFFHSFQRTLPNEPAIEHEIAAYQDKVARGFIAPATLLPPSAADHRESMAVVHSGGREMAGSAMNTALAGRSFGGAQGVALASNGGGSSGAGLTLSGGSISGASTYTGVTLSGGSISGTSTYTGVTSVSGASLSGSGTFASGGTIVSGGTLNLSGSGSIAHTGSAGLTINSGYSGTLNLSGGNTLIVGGNTIQLTGASTVTIGSGVVTGINTTGTLSVNGGAFTSPNTGNSYTGGAGTIALYNISGNLTVVSGAANLSGNTGVTLTTGGIHAIPVTPSSVH